MRGLDITSYRGRRGRWWGGGGTEKAQPAGSKFKIKIIQLAGLIDRRAVKSCAVWRFYAQDFQLIRLPDMSKTIKNNTQERICLQNGTMSRMRVFKSS